jgi:hypothetical protein
MPRASLPPSPRITPLTAGPPPSTCGQVAAPVATVAAVYGHASAPILGSTSGAVRAGGQVSAAADSGAAALYMHAESSA